MKEKLCTLFESCQSAEAPLCPLQESTVKKGIWYPDEGICQASQFQELPWVKKQHLIADLKLKSNAGFFTVRMLDALHVINVTIRGADPDYSNAEDKWFAEHGAIRKKDKGNRVKKSNIIAHQKPVTMPMFNAADFLPVAHKPEKKNIPETIAHVKKSKNKDSKKSKTVAKKMPKPRKGNK